MDTFLVMTPGPYMTVQDKGRIGFQQMGIPVSGALDGFAFRTANLLVIEQGQRKVFRRHPGKEIFRSSNSRVIGNRGRTSIPPPGRAMP